MNAMSYKHEFCQGGSLPMMTRVVDALMFDYSLPDLFNSAVIVFFKKK
jgi:hypothetical protein